MVASSDEKIAFSRLIGIFDDQKVDIQLVRLVRGSKRCIAMLDDTVALGDFMSSTESPSIPISGR